MCVRELRHELAEEVPVSGWAQILSLGAAFGGLAGGFGAGATAQGEERRAGPWLWRGGRGAAAVSAHSRVRHVLEAEAILLAHAQLLAARVRRLARREDLGAERRGAVQRLRADGSARAGERVVHTWGVMTR